MTDLYKNFCQVVAASHAIVVAAQPICERAKLDVTDQNFLFTFMAANMHVAGARTESQAMLQKQQAVDLFSDLYDAAIVQAKKKGIYPVEQRH